MPWPRFWGWGEFEAKKKAHLSQLYDNFVQKLEKVELGDKFHPSSREGPVMSRYRLRKDYDSFSFSRQ